MNLIEQLGHDAQSKKCWRKRLVSKRILDLLDIWENDGKDDVYISDHFIFSHTFNINVKLYKIFSELSDEQVDKFDDIMEMLSNPRQ